MAEAWERFRTRGRSGKVTVGTPVCAGQTGRQPAELPGLSVAGLRAGKGIGNLAVDPDSSPPLP